MTPPKPVVLCILDGWGIGPVREWDAPALAHTPNFDALMASCPHATLTTFGPDVGLPTGQMGNSEVGHTNIGAGRVVAMDLGAIDLAVEDGSFAENEALLAFIAKVKAAGGVAHLMGVVSDGGVHGHITHVIAACRAVTAAGVPVWLHAITDGRDTSPKGGAAYMAKLEKDLEGSGAKIVTVIGRYFAMDRDTRWERNKLAWDAIVLGRGEQRSDLPSEAVALAYPGEPRGDEFLQPMIFGLAEEQRIRDGDVVFWFNFRADRARQLSGAGALAH